MELNGFVIKSRRLLGENFLPFQEIWAHVEDGLYQECLNTFLISDELTPEILSVSAWLLNGKTECLPKRNFQKEYQNFVQNNQELTQALEDAAGNEKQKSVLYLCVLMHIHAGHSRLTSETGEFIHKLLKDRETMIVETNILGEPKMHRQQFGIIGSEAYYLDESGRIVSQRNRYPLPIAKDLIGLRSFAYTDMLGLIAIDGNGQVQSREGLSFLDIPCRAKMVSVSAYLSSYMLLDENGAVYTNIDMDLSDWTDLRYIYVGLNSAAGIKRWSGNTVTVGVGEVPTFTNAIRMYTYHYGSKKHYIALLANGELKHDGWKSTDDKTEDYKGVTAVALSAEGYYYAKEDGKVYKRVYDKEHAKEEFCMKAEGRVKELLAWQEKIFAFL